MSPFKSSPLFSIFFFFSTAFSIPLSPQDVVELGQPLLDVNIIRGQLILPLCAIAGAGVAGCLHHLNHCLRTKQALSKKPLIEVFAWAADMHPSQVMPWIKGVLREQEQTGHLIRRDDGTFC